MQINKQKGSLIFYNTLTIYKIQLYPKKYLFIRSVFYFLVHAELFLFFSFIAMNVNQLKKYFPWILIPIIIKNSEYFQRCW